MLNEKQKDLVKATVPVLKENGEALTDYFYKRMLKNNPGLKETFNMGHQRSGAQRCAGKSSGGSRAGLRLKYRQSGSAVTGY